MPSFPAGSPAANVHVFKDAPVERWFEDAGEWALILSDGSYASVEPDHEDTGHWFGTVVYADGSEGDTWNDNVEAVKAKCEAMLRKD